MRYGIGTKREALEILKNARFLLEEENGWTQNVFARGQSGRKVEVMSKSATCYCSLGAIEKSTGIVLGNIHHPFRWQTKSTEYAQRKLSDAFASDLIAAVNDHYETMHLHILMAFDFAILILQDELSEAICHTK